MRIDVLISKVNNRLQASLRTLSGNRYITINGRKKFKVPAWAFCLRARNFSRRPWLDW